MFDSLFQQNILFYSFILVLCAGLIASCHTGTSSKEGTADEISYYEMEDYDRVAKIDAHVHIRTADPAFMEQARADHFRLLTIVVDEEPGIEQQREYALLAVKNFPDVVAFATTIAVDRWKEDLWETETIAALKNSLDQGAIAVKIYKNIGMELRDEQGGFVMIDHPRFVPVFKFLSERGVPVVGHLGEPKNCWLPVEEMTVKSDQRYFTRHPEFHMFLHPEYPSYEDQIDARDQILVNHPELLFVGAHLGSLEWSVEELARRLDRFPNMAVDMAARISSVQYLTRSDREEVRDFFIEYQDRLIYGSDRIVNEGGDPEEVKKNVHELWLRDWKFFCTDQKMTSGSFDGEFYGLKLPQEVIDKIYRKNAERWFRPMKSMSAISGGH